jgi:uncharacterized protein YkwD
MSPATPAGVLSRARFPLAAALAAVAVVLALVLPQTALAATSTTSPAVAQMTQRVVDDTNAVRAEQGLPALVRDSRLDKVAADWARQQFENGAMSHNPNYSTQIPPGWQRAGENVGKGYTYTQIVPAWKASSSHYANLVNDYTSVGVGYYEQDGRRYWSQVFAKYPGVAQPAQPAPAQPAPTQPAPAQPAPSSPPASPKPSASPTPAPSSSAGSTASPAAEPAAPAGTAIALSSPSFESGLGSWSAPSGATARTRARGAAPARCWYRVPRTARSRRACRRASRRARPTRRPSM